MKKLHASELQNLEGGLNALAAFGCGMGVAFMIANPVSIFAIGEMTGVMCAASFL